MKADDPDFKTLVTDILSRPRIDVNNPKPPRAKKTRTPKPCDITKPN